VIWQKVETLAVCLLDMHHRVGFTQVVFVELLHQEFLGPHNKSCMSFKFAAMTVCSCCKSTGHKHQPSITAQARCFQDEGAERNGTAYHSSLFWCWCCFSRPQPHLPAGLQRKVMKQRLERERPDCAGRSDGERTSSSVMPFGFPVRWLVAGSYTCQAPLESKDWKH
jgi:hypothetical protein